MLDDRQNLAGADFVRSLACLGVVAHHLAQRLDPHALSPTLRDIHSASILGAFGVGAFFVLSGYLLSRPFWLAIDAGKPMPSLRHYALRRLARIAPGYWAALLVTFVLSITLFGVRLDAALVQRFLAGAGFMSAWHWLTMFPVEVNGPLWSIGFEVMSYLLLPLCLVPMFIGNRFGLRGWPARAVWLGAILVAIGAHGITIATIRIPPAGTGWQYGLVGGARAWMPEYNVFGFFAMFAIGALAGGLQVLCAGRRHVIFDLLFLTGLALAWWAAGPYLSRAIAEGWGWLDIPYCYPLFPLGIGLALAAAPSSLWIRHLTELGIFRYVALISFGLYVWHYLVLELIRQLAAPAFHFAGISDPAYWALLSLVGVGLSILVAHLSYRLIERPVLDWGRRVETRGIGGRKRQTAS
ncbi:MAG: acyltransferase [Alphaproteobacteria bacterium]|nr:acyltransferase [Alphaproteobacteria bacterium]